MATKQAVNHVFVYGSLRPDDDSGMPWTTAAVEGMRAQKAHLPGAKLYKDQYACVVLGPNAETRTTTDEDASSQVVGWVLTVSDTEMFEQKLEYFDRIEGYDPNGGGLYDRAVASVVLSDPSHCMPPNDAIGQKDQVLQAYVYHRPDCEKDELIPSGDWLKRNRATD